MIIAAGRLACANNLRTVETILLGMAFWSLTQQYDMQSSSNLPLVRGLL
jgi:hypothetical protein